MPAKAATFGEFIRERRIRKGLSLRRFAELVGLSPAYVSQIENGIQSPPPADRARTMAKVLGESPDVLIILAGRIPNDITTILQETPEAMAEFIREAGELSAEQFDQLREHARQLKQPKRRPTK